MTDHDLKAAHPKEWALGDLRGACQTALLHLRLNDPAKARRALEAVLERNANA